MIEVLTIEGLHIEVRLSSRRKNVSLTVDRGGELVIHAPDSFATEELSSWVKGKLLWIQGKLAHREKLVSHVRDPEYVSGERFGYLGRTYRLVVVQDQEQALHFDGTSFFLREDVRSEAVAHFRCWYISNGTEWVENRVQRLATKTGIRPNRIELRDLGYRWGSCGKNQVLYFNWKALQFPVRLLDYILLHELAHLIEKNHSKAYWGILDRALPDWTQRKEEVQSKARELFWCGVTSN